MALLDRPGRRVIPVHRALLVRWEHKGRLVRRVTKETAEGLGWLVQWARLVRRVFKGSVDRLDLLGRAENLDLRNRPDRQERPIRSRMV